LIELTQVQAQVKAHGDLACYTPLCCADVHGGCQQRIDLNLMTLGMAISSSVMMANLANREVSQVRVHIIVV
jgi:hypothetical protein